MCLYFNDSVLVQSSDDLEEEILNETTDNGAFSVERDGKYIHCLTIIGQVEGHYILPPSNKTTKYEHVIPQLVAIEENDDIDGLLIILNTVGGDVEAGLAIAELISGMRKPTASLVLGGGHSIGVPLAVSADRSFIVPTATMTIHPVRMNGLVLGVPQTLSYFDKMQERIVKFVSQNSALLTNKFVTSDYCIRGGPFLVATRSRRGSNMPPAYHSLPRRRSATPRAPLRLKGQ